MLVECIRKRVLRNGEFWTTWRIFYAAMTTKDGTCGSLKYVFFVLRFLYDETICLRNRFTSLLNNCYLLLSNTYTYLRLRRNNVVSIVKLMSKLEAERRRRKNDCSVCVVGISSSMCMHIPLCWDTQLVGNVRLHENLVKYLEYVFFVIFNSRRSLNEISLWVGIGGDLEMDSNENCSFVDIFWKSM